MTPNATAKRPEVKAAKTRTEPVVIERHVTIMCMACASRELHLVRDATATGGKLTATCQKCGHVIKA